jgi:adenylate cyclase
LKWMAAQSPRADGKWLGSSIQFNYRITIMPSLNKILPPSRLSGFAAIAVFALLRLWDPAPIEIARNLYFDFLQRGHPRHVEDYPVTIVDIDDRSLNQIGQWPWPRSLLADLTKRLSDDGAAVIGFSMIFPDQDRLSPRRLAVLFQPGGDIRQRLAELSDNDELFAEAIKNARVVLGRTAAPQAADEIARAARAAPKISIVTVGGDPKGDLLHYPGELKNIAVLENAAAGLGMLTVRPERGGVIRRAPLLLVAGNEIAPGMVIELIRVAAGASNIIVKRDEAGVKSVALAGVEIPADADGQLWIAFAAHDPKRYISAADVLTGSVPRRFIQNKIILVGSSAAGFSDLKATPLDRVIPGVEFYAQIVENVLDATTLIRPNFAAGLEISLAIMIGAILVVTTPLFGALVNFLTGGVVAFLLAATSWYQFTIHRVLIDVSYPVASSFAVFLLIAFMNYRREEERRGKIRAAFSQYISPDLVEQLIREPNRLVLGGETREISILFSDVRGFTSIAESFKDNPAGLTALMNRMLTSLSRPIIDRRGTIDKYMGDAIMAFWNAPLDDEDHPVNACEAALELTYRLDDLNAERRREAQKQGAPVTDMEIGIGISTGIAVVGNMGSDIRFDYSALGDRVNLASRLEGLTATYGLPILIAAETARRCTGKFAIVEVDRVQVKGKQDPETVYALFGGKEFAQKQQFISFCDAFHSMLNHYRARDWDKALECLGLCREADREGKRKRLLTIYFSRISEFAANPPPPDWKGVFKVRISAS